MSISVEQLIAQRDLSTRVIAGQAGLGRSVGWAHVCELPEPWEWIGHGDLLMTTGLGIPATAEAQLSYVHRLADVGAAGLAIGENMQAPPLTQEMLDAADERRLPLLFTRYEIPFIALARAVAEASAREDWTRIEQTARVYELLRRSSVLDLILEELVSSLEEAVSCDLLVADPASGRSMLHDRPLTASLRESVRGWGIRARDDAPVILHLADGDGVGVVMPGPRPALLIALARDGRLPDSTVLRHVAAATALQQTWLFAKRERAKRLGASLLAQLLDQRLDPATAQTQLQEYGLRELPLVLLACTPGDGEDELHQLHHALDDTGADHLMLSRGPVTHVLMEDDRGWLDALTGELPNGSAIGVSDPFEDPGDLPAAQREALWSLHRAQERRLPVVHHSDDFGQSLFLPATREDSCAVARRVLGPVLQYDAAHGSDLVATLRAFLEENRSWQRTSARLHVHKQTLVYRVNRIEALTGRSVSNTADVAELWLSLQAAASAALLEQRA
jgi:PucR family transcriptional regulator, purine catabolism regulatory protein